VKQKQRIETEATFQEETETTFQEETETAIRKQNTRKEIKI